MSKLKTLLIFVMSMLSNEFKNIIIQESSVDFSSAENHPEWLSLIARCSSDYNVKRTWILPNKHDNGTCETDHFNIDNDHE